MCTNEKGSIFGFAKTLGMVKIAADYFVFQLAIAGICQQDADSCRLELRLVYVMKIGRQP